MIKQLLDLAFVWSDELRRCQRVLSASANYTILDLQNSSDHTKPYPIMANYLILTLVINSEQN